MSKSTSAISKSVTKAIAVLMYASLLCNSTALTKVNSAPAQQQQPTEPEWSLQPTPDGYAGTYNAAGETVLLKAHRLSRKSALSSLRRPNGYTLIEILRDGDENIVEFRLPGMKLAIDLANRTFIGLSEKDQGKLQKFLGSSDATLARKCISKLIQLHRQTKERKFIPVGLMIAGMLLGDELPSIEASQSKTEPVNRLILT